MAIDTVKIPGHEVWVRLPKGCFAFLEAVAEANGESRDMVLLMMVSHFWAGLDSGELEELWGLNAPPTTEYSPADPRISSTEETGEVIPLFRPLSE